MRKRKGIDHLVLVVGFLVVASALLDIAISTIEKLAESQPGLVSEAIASGLFAFVLCLLFAGALAVMSRVL